MKIQLKHRQNEHVENIEINFSLSYFEHIEIFLTNADGFYLNEIYNFLREEYLNITSSTTLFRALFKHEFELFKSDLNQLEMLLDVFDTFTKDSTIMNCTT